MNILCTFHHKVTSELKKITNSCIHLKTEPQNKNTENEYKDGLNIKIRVDLKLLISSQSMFKVIKECQK